MSSGPGSAKQEALNHYPPRPLTPQPPPHPQLSPMLCQELASDGGAFTFACSSHYLLLPNLQIPG